MENELTAEEIAARAAEEAAGRRCGLGLLHCPGVTSVRRSLVETDYALAHGVLRELCDGIHAQLLYQAGAVSVNRSSTQAQTAGNHLRGLSLRQHLEHLSFSRRQQRPGRHVLPRAHPQVVLDYGAGHER